MQKVCFRPLKRPIALIAAAAIIFYLIACGGNGDDDSDDQNPTIPPQGLYEKYPIDGVVAWSELIDEMSATVDIRDNWGSGAVVNTSDVRWAWVNDDRYLYLAVEWTDDTYNHGYNSAGPVDFDGVQVSFDNDGNGTNETGEDKRTIITASVGSQYIDGIYNPGSDENDQVADGFGKLRYDAGNQNYSAEFLLPLITDANGEDADFSGAPSFSIAIFENANIGLGQVNMGATHTIFERFNKNTDYATDLETPFTPWDIVAVRLDGTDETVLLTDGWVNWLPIYGPKGRYILYLKSVGYTAAHLMTRDGEELGRLVPGMTRIKYVDWK